MPLDDMNAVQIRTRFDFDIENALMQLNKIVTGINNVNIALLKLENTAKHVGENLTQNFQKLDIFNKIQQETANTIETIAHQAANLNATTAKNVTLKAQEAASIKRQLDISIKQLKYEEERLRVEQERIKLDIQSYKLEQEKVKLERELLRLELERKRVAGSTTGTPTGTPTRTPTRTPTGKAPFNIIESQFERRLSWFVVGTMFFGTTAAMREAVNTMSEVEMGMTEIARVTEDTRFNFEEMRNELVDLGIQFGTTFDTVQDIALRWAQAGYNVSDTLELTRASLLALNTAELNAEQATSGLIAVMAQWGLQASQLIPTIDKINKVADDYAITSEDLIDGLVRSSGAAKLMNLSLEETIAILTVMREATGRTGREVGNALNSILSFMQRPKALKGFEALGIQVYANEAKTQFRSVLEVLEELSEKWPEVEGRLDLQAMFEDAAKEAGLYSEAIAEATDTVDEFNDVQAAEAAGLAAGVYRRNYLVALLKNFSKVQEVVNTALSAEGYSMRENARTMETLQKKYESLKAALEGLAIALGEAGLLDTLKLLVSTTTELVKAFNSIDETTRSIIMNFGLIFGIVKLISSIVKMFGIGAATTAATAAATAGAATTAGTAAATAGAAATAAKAAAAIPGYWKLIAIGVATAGMTIYSKIKQANEETTRHIKTVGELGEKYFELKQTMSELAPSSYEYISAQNNLKEVMKDLANVQPTLIEGIGEHAKITAIDEEALNKQVEAYNKLTEAQRKQEEATKTATQKIEEIQTASQEKINKYEREIELLPQLLKMYEESKEGTKEKENAERSLIGILDTKEKSIWEEIKASGELKKGIDKEIEKRRELIEEQKQNALDSIIIEQNRLEAQLKIIEEEIQKLQELKEEREKAVGPTFLERFEEKSESIPEGESTAKGVIALFSSAQEVIDKFFSKYRENVFAVIAGKKSIGEAVKDLFTTEREAYEETSKELLKKIDEYKKLKDELDEIKTRIAETVAKTVAGTVEKGEDVGLGNLDKYVLNIDRYMALNAVLDSINIAIEKNQALEANVTGRDRIPFIKAENELLEQKQNILHALNEERRKETEEIKEYLISQGIKFDATGNMLNADAVLRARTAAYNSMLGDTEKQRKARRLAREDIDALQDKIKRYVDLIHREIPAASKDWHELATEIAKNNKEIENINFKSLIDEMKHFARMGVFTTQQQIEKYRELFNVIKLTTEEAWQKDEEIFDLYKDLLKEQQDMIEKAYKERIEMIKKESKEKINAQKEIIAGIEEELDLLEKREEEYSFEQKMADLKEELAYWSVRTSEEARKKVADINKQIAELEHDREVELKKQELEEKRRAAEKEIDTIEETTKTEIEKWEAAYKVVEEAFNEHYTNIVARAATMSKEAYQQWVDNYIVPLQEALEIGKAEYLEFAAEKLKLGTSKLPSHDWGMSEEDYQTMMENKERWWELYYQGYRESTNTEMQRLHAENDAIRRKYGRNPALGEYPKFHEGAKTLSYGIAMFKPGELIFPPGLSTKLEELISVLSTRPVTQVRTAMDEKKLVQNFYAPLFNSERTYFEDEIDGEILSKQLKRGIVAISR